MRVYIVMFLLVLTLSSSCSVMSADNSMILAEDTCEYGVNLDEYIERGPIIIVGDSDPAWGQFDGNGSVTSPYIIEGFYFNMNNTAYNWHESTYTYTDAIELRDVTIHWIVRNCVFRGSNNLVEDPDGDWMDIHGYGICTVRTSNGLIEGCTFIHFNRGIQMDQCFDISIQNSAFYGYSYPQIRDIDVEGVTYYFDSYQTYGLGIHVEPGINQLSHDILICNNTFYNCTSSVLLNKAVYVNIENNTVIGCDWGVQVSWSSWTNNITGNFFRHNLYAGIAVGLSSLLFITNNTLIENYRGICIFEMATGTYVAFNTLIGNGASIFTNTTSGFSLAQSTYPPGIGIWVSDGTGAHMRWNDFVVNDISARNDIADNEYDYNYYSDYSGTDVDDDDIGDTPYDVQGDSPTQDSHPRTKRMSYYVMQTTTQSSEQPSLPVDTLTMLGVGGGIILVAMAIVFMKRK